MVDKITLLNEKGESIQSDEVAVFNVNGKKILITTDNALDPNGLVVLNVSEVVEDNKLVTITDDNLWSSVCDAMRSTIAGKDDVAYEPLIEQANVNVANSFRAISVEGDAVKSMKENYANKRPVAQPDVSQPILDESSIMPDNANMFDGPAPAASIYPDGGAPVVPDMSQVPMGTEVANGIAEVPAAQTEVQEEQPAIPEVQPAIPEVQPAMPDGQMVQQPMPDMTGQAQAVADVNGMAQQKPQPVDSAPAVQSIAPDAMLGVQPIAPDANAMMQQTTDFQQVNNLENPVDLMDNTAQPAPMEPTPMGGQVPAVPAAPAGGLDVSNVVNSIPSKVGQVDPKILAALEILDATVINMADAVISNAMEQMNAERMAFEAEKKDFELRRAGWEAQVMNGVNQNNITQFPQPQPTVAPQPYAGTVDANAFQQPMPGVVPQGGNVAQFPQQAVQQPMMQPGGLDPNMMNQSMMGQQPAGPGMGMGNAA